MVKMCHDQLDSDGHPIFVRDGEEFFYLGKSKAGCLVWQSRVADPSIALKQLVVRPGDGELMHVATDPKDFVTLE